MNSLVRKCPSVNPDRRNLLEKYTHWGKWKILCVREGGVTHDRDKGEDVVKGRLLDFS